MLKHVKGNLIDFAEHGKFDIIVHGCNCQNTMGSGIAKEIRERYPIVYRADYNMHASVKYPVELLGQYSLHIGCPSGIEGNEFTVVNAYTQVNYMPRGVDHFEYESFALILRKLQARFPRKRFGFPYIGMGLAGGNKDKIMKLLEDFARNITKTGGEVTLVEFDG